MLDYFATTYLDHPDYSFARRLKAAANIVSPRLGRQIARRTFADVGFGRVRTRPLWELARTFAGTVMRAPRLTDAIWEHGDHAFDRWVAAGLDGHSAVYTYEHAALATLRAARANGQVAFYEQPSQHHSFFSRVYDEQVRRYPEIVNAATALTSTEKSAPRDRRRDAELAAATCVLCNSSFTKRSLIAAGVEPTKIEVTPYGFPAAAARPLPTTGPVVFMSAGTQSLRKGAHLLYRAWRTLGAHDEDAELWLIGRMVLPESLRAGLPGRVRILDSVPHTELLSTYHDASVFVLPSLADGFGMVLTEAMSRGLAVITTENTGGPDIIRHGENGLIVPAGDEDALREQMRWCLQHREHVREIGARAALTAARWTWSHYREMLVATLRRRLAGAGDG